MIQRCTTPSHKQWGNYGGRGITVCPEWFDFSVFIKDMGKRPPGLTLDRINNDAGYSKENCRWATPFQQVHNRRKIRPHDQYGEKNASAKLTEAHVLAIRGAIAALNIPRRDIAEIFDVSKATIWLIQTRRAWVSK